MDKDKLKAGSKKWGKRIVIYGALGITGLAAVGVFNLYRSMRGLSTIDLDNLKL